MNRNKAQALANDATGGGLHPEDLAKLLDAYQVEETAGGFLLRVGRKLPKMIDTNELGVITEALYPGNVSELVETEANEGGPDDLDANSPDASGES